MDCNAFKLILSNHLVKIFGPSHFGAKDNHLIITYNMQNIQKSFVLDFLRAVNVKLLETMKSQILFFSDDNLFWVRSHELLSGLNNLLV